MGLNIALTTYPPDRIVIDRGFLIYVVMGK